MRKWILPAAAALALLAACQPEGQAPQEPGANEATPAGAPPVQIADTIHGTVNVNEPIPIDPGSRLDVRLVDVAQPEVVLAQQVFDVGGTPPPFTFDLPLDPARIDPARTYVLNIVLTDGDRRFLPPLSTPVLTGGAGANPQIVLNPEPTPAESMKEAFQKLQAHIGGMKKVDGTFTTDDASVGWDAFADKGNVRFVRVNTVFDAGGRSAVKFAYLDGKPMAVVRQEGGVTTRLGWDPAGAVVLNEKTGGGTLTEEEIAALRASAEEAYTRAQGRVDATRKKRR